MKRASIHTARLLRRKSTPEERRLWFHLRNQKLGGLKFRRQQPFDSYVVDFYCSERNLVIELDGGQHGSETGKIGDKERDAVLASKGVKVLRFWNRQVRKNLEGVLETIAMELKLENHPSPCSSPTRGEENEINRSAVSEPMRVTERHRL